ncbi:MAG: alpha-glucosidase C-terminal domain-containing protein, partial [Actinobacteria bacterium]|nr:alpha-glucosidase C-terminal domain-containing protein [Actinomycetota bacterium]
GDPEPDDVPWLPQEPDPAQSPGQTRLWQPAAASRDRQLELNRHAQEFFTGAYPDSWAAGHLLERLGTDLIDDPRFAPGYAPASWTKLTDHLRGLGASEAELRDASSMIHWMRRMIEVRKQHALFGTGSFEVVNVDNPSVLAYVRQQDDDVVLCVNNLSRFAQPAELPLQHLAGRTPIELLGRVPFPKVGDLPYFVTLGPYAFYWFQLVEQQ